MMDRKNEMQKPCTKSEFDPSTRRFGVPDIGHQESKRHYQRVRKRERRRGVWEGKKGLLALEGGGRERGEAERLNL